MRGTRCTSHLAQHRVLRASECKYLASRAEALRKEKTPGCKQLHGTAGTLFLLPRFALHAARSEYWVLCPLSTCLAHTPLTDDLPSLLFLSRLILLHCTLLYHDSSANKGYHRLGLPSCGATQPREQKESNACRLTSVCFSLPLQPPRAQSPSEGTRRPA